ncbi:Hypothetical predicted protein [Lecanosticta acicola]|uniref:Uncharacterized protein n=1 Tax=Lecanosticta acicola TaxID=111012 RepID=A0AAI8YZE1_9PEZI|nr:Hypothetical predicted protein [Lecanosticta acicola]
MLPSKAFRTAVTALVACSVFLILLWGTGAVPNLRPSLKDTVEKPIGDRLTEFVPPEPGKGRLHLLVPATSSNDDLCKLMVSAQILGFPSPVLINYGDDEAEDPYVQHLAKVEGLLEYLDKIEDSSEYDSDLVLVVDGYDVWFQLRPDVLIKRYYEAIKEADARAVQVYGKETVENNSITHTVLLGPDKVCWPVDFSRPACWAAPATTLGQYGFGPQTSDGRDDNNDPKWLNSGTIMGPAQDLRDFFRGTLELIHENHTTDSDQYYMAQLFGLQEYKRLSHNETRLQEFRDTRYADELSDKEKAIMRFEPSLESDKKTEYHILIDGSFSLFQTLAFMKQYITFTTPSDSWSPQVEGQEPFWTPYQVEPPQDLLRSTPPFDLSSDAGTRSTTWDQVTLLYNTISKTFPVLIHFTGEKQYRDIWWQRMWFQSNASELRKSSAKLLDEAISDDIIDGKKWVKAMSEHAKEYKEAGISGFESDRRGWLSWRAVCGPMEGALFVTRGQEKFHPREPPEPPALAWQHIPVADGEAAGGVG